MLTRIARDEQHLQLLRTLGMQSALAVPLRARGHTVGALTIVSASAPEAYGPQQVRLAMDVAGRAALAVENARLYGELERALGTRDEFLASAAHDLRTPLTAIKGSVQLLQRQLATGKEDLPDRLHWGLGTINTTATRMAEMIDSLLDVARLQLGRALELERAPTDLVALARAVLAEEEPSSARHEVTVEGDDAVVGEWDGSRLYRVIANLLDNAVKYSPSGGTVSIAIYASEVDGSCEAVLTVRDEGIGIPREDLGGVFERFRRGSNVVGRIAGTGLGLAGARQIVEQHGGTIGIESTEGAGTTVTVRLPLDRRPQP
jgi:signal transduction histidine kinase